MDYATGTTPWSIHAADVNGDGRPATVFLLAPRSVDQAQDFAPKVDYATGIEPSSIHAADVNGDGRPDLLTANSGSSTASVLINHGDGIFAAKVDYATGETPWSIHAADVNGDGRPDLLTANVHGNTVSVLINQTPCPADLNHDGLVDFLDYLELLNLYDAQDPRGDFNHDGVIDLGDYLDFLEHYDAGC